MGTLSSSEYGRIYLITNIVNGKKYVGQTVRAIAKRFVEHCRLQGKCRALESAIGKYGVASFKIELLAIASDQKQLDELEAEYISSIGSMTPAGYNLISGGGGGGKACMETRELQRAFALSPSGILRMQKLRSDPSFIPKIRAAGVHNWPQYVDRMRAGFARPEVQARRIESVRMAYKRPDVLARINVHLAELRTRPEVRAAKSDELTRIWSDPVEKARRSKAISDSLLGHTKNIDYSDQAKAHRKAIANARWADPEYRALMKARNSDPEVIKRRGEAIRAGHARKKAERLAVQT